jgi:hypothetical protein
MERRAASHTEEEEMNQRRRLLGLARKGDPKAIAKLFELYQVRVLSGDMLNKLNKSYYKAAAQQQKSSHQPTGKGAKSLKSAHGDAKTAQKPSKSQPSKPAARKGALPAKSKRSGR